MAAIDADEYIGRKKNEEETDAEIRWAAVAASSAPGADTRGADFAAATLVAQDDHDAFLQNERDESTVAHAAMEAALAQKDAQLQNLRQAVETEDSDSIADILVQSAETQVNAESGNSEDDDTLFELRRGLGSRPKCKHRAPKMQAPGAQNVSTARPKCKHRAPKM